MKGYAYLDLDNNLVYKTANYIDTENPGFFSHNIHLIIKHWKFDTDDKSSMLRLFHVISELAIPKNNVRSFIESIGYDMNKLKNADKI